MGPLGPSDPSDLAHLPARSQPLMSYLVIARKWRPQRFDEVIGQPHVVRTLENAIQSNRVAHAYLFTGARGVGKTSVARILAKALNCEQGVSSTPCNQCANCLEITQGNSPDVLEIDGASNRGIDNIRELRETVRYRPLKSASKIYIIDEVHMLTTEAFNALLKTLEEPPAHVRFLFATTEPHKIPATIASRCQRFDFRRIPTSVVLTHLKNIAAAEQADLSEAILYTVAQEADGSMRDAQSLLEQLLAFRNQDLDDAEILEILGVMDRGSIYRVGQAIIAGDAVVCLEVVESVYQRGIDSKRFCQQLCDYFRNLLFLSLDHSAGKSWLDLPREEQDRLKDSLKSTSSETLHLYFQMMLKGEEAIRHAAQPRITLEMLLLRLCQLPRLQTLDQILSRLGELESRWASAPTGVGPDRATAGTAAAADGEGQAASPVGLEEGQPRLARSPAGEPAAVAPPIPPPLDPPITLAPGQEVDDWPAFVSRLQTDDPMLGAKLGQSRLRLDEHGRMHLQILEMYEELLKAPDTLIKLTGLLRRRYGIEGEPLIEIGGPGAATKARARTESNRRGQSRSLVMDHPMVRQAIEVLGGELVEIRELKQ